MVTRTPTFQDALALFGQGNLAGAARVCQGILALQPTHPGALHLLGVAFLQAGNAEHAVLLIRKSLQARPEQSDAWSNLSNALLELNRKEEAFDAVCRAQSLAPGDARIWNTHGSILLEMARADEALVSFDKALEIQPGHAGAATNRGNALLRMGRLEEAVGSYRRAIEINPDDQTALANLGTALLGAIGAVSNVEAAGDGPRGGQEGAGNATRGAPDFDAVARLLGSGVRDYSLGAVLHARLSVFCWDQYEEILGLILRSIELGRSATTPLWLLAVSDSAAVQLSCARQYSTRWRLTEGRHAVATRLAGRASGHERIKVAYVSGDFRSHAVAVLMAGVLEEHDHGRFEIIGASLRPAEASTLGNRIRSACDRFIDFSGKDDAQVAAELREMQVDIAVDLMGFTTGARPGIFANRAAPVQVNYLGFPGTMGAEFMDYLIADEFIVPDRMEQGYAERIVRMPRIFQANDSARPAPGAVRKLQRAEHGLPEHGVVLCCFNSAFKVTPSMFDVWCRVLRAVPDAVLWLVASSSGARENLRQEMRRRGVAESRLVFAGRVSFEDYLARMELADLFLDTVPFNGGTTVADALWTGLPVLTCVGEAFAARMAGSLLSQLGLPELLARGLDEYETQATALAGDRRRLVELRRRVRESVAASGVYDAARFCRELETAYETMCNWHRRGEPTSAFSV